ncbi:MAG: CoB--CoM heterodisulfide reductase iron-sulfur subunit A family protein [Candidatus Bathyarchaeota archaeon]|nr:MAG: CoB--CoM heterodisulfide reductase iron-sulfur subunit A family protein [Candidatus Bathyarchaeota archaeon]
MPIFVSFLHPLQQSQFLFYCCLISLSSLHAGKALNRPILRFQSSSWVRTVSRTGKSRGPEEPRIGVFICHCGSNIADIVDVKEVVDFASKFPNVVFAVDERYVCSEPGQALIRENIRKHKLNRVIVASCSPRMHETTFRKALEAEGLNPFLLEITNLREQCSWVHMHEPRKATQKAKVLVASAIAKATLLEPLTPMKFSVTPAALVIGGGIAGIQASLDLANIGFKVHLVEKTPSIGGHMAQLDKTFPTLDCSACILTPKMVDVSRHPNITLWSYSEVESISGFIGNFKATIVEKARYINKSLCTGCGTCASKCPVKTIPNEFDLGLGTRSVAYIPFPQAVPLIYTIDKENCLYFTKGVCRVCEKTCPFKAVDFNQQDKKVEIEVGTIVIATGYDLFDANRKPEYGYKQYKNVLTNLEFERLISAAGPTGGQLVRPSDGRAPKKIAFVQCIGSRDILTNPYCSRVCCMASVKQAHQAKEKYPDAKVFVFYIDLRTFGKGYEEFLWRVQEEGVNLVRGKVAEIYRKPKDENLTVLFEDTLLGQTREMDFDMVILAAGLEPRVDAQQIQKALKLSMSPDSFFLEAHPKLRPVETHIAGVYLCGCAQGPKDIPDVVAQASAAASQASIPLIQGEVVSEPTIAYVDKELCCSCKICESVCVYDAIEADETDEEKRAKVNEALCVGCGSCAAACPARAITMYGFTKEQISKQLAALLTEPT